MSQTLPPSYIVLLSVIDPPIDNSVRISLTTDVIYNILTFCSTSQLGKIARTSRTLNSLAIPLLYRHLSLDLAVLNPLSDPSNHHGTARSTPSAIERSTDTSTRSPNLQNVQTLHITPHHRSLCATFESSTACHPKVILPNLRSLHFQIDRRTYHWPHGCPLVQALNPAPEEIILSADRGCDVLYWAFGVRYYDEIPEGVKRVVFMTKHSPGVGMQEAREERGETGGDSRTTSSLNRIIQKKNLRTMKDIVLVYDESWESEAARSDSCLDLELGNIAVLAVRVAGSRLTIRGLSAAGGKVDNTDVEAVMRDKIEGYVNKLVGFDGGGQGASAEEAMAKIHFSN